MGLGWASCLVHMHARGPLMVHDGTMDGKRKWLFCESEASINESGEPRGDPQ